jgi:hypothetical protein
MKSRLALLPALVVGFVALSAGSAVAAQSSSDAAAAQYEQPSAEAPTLAPQPAAPAPAAPAPAAPDEAEVLPQVESRQPTPAARPERAAPQAAPEAEQPAAAAQPARQAAVPEGSLPFTGFAAIPLLVLGVAALVAGLLLRRRSSQG